MYFRQSHDLSWINLKSWNLYNYLMVACNVIHYPRVAYECIFLEIDVRTVEEECRVLWETCRELKQIFG